MLLICFLTINFISLIWNELYFEIREDQFFEQLRENVICLASNPNPESCPPAPSPSMVSLFITNILIASEGVMIFFIFGVQKRNYRIWRSLFLGSSVSASDKTTDKTPQISMSNIDKETKESAEFSQ